MGRNKKKVDEGTHSNRRVSGGQPPVGAAEDCRRQVTPRQWSYKLKNLSTATEAAVRKGKHLAGLNPSNQTTAECKPKASGATPMH